MSEYDVTLTLDQLRDLVAQAGKRLPDIARVALRASMQAMVADAVRNRMSGQYLGVVTGIGRNSVSDSGTVDSQGDSIVAGIGSPLGYIAAHERGFHGPVQVRAHQRRLHQLRIGRSGKATKKSIAARQAALLAKHKTHSLVRAHTRQVNIRARRFLRDTLYQEAGQLPGLLQGGEAPVARRMLKALRIFVEQRRMPRPGELGLGNG